MTHKVLLFDRDVVSLTAMRDVLHRAQYQVGCGQTLDEIAALLSANRWDVAVIDLLSEQSIGLDVLRHLQQLPQPPACVVTVRFGHEAWKSAAIGLGALHCIEQPLTATLLIALVHTTAGSRRADAASAEPDGVVCHALSRWADVVVRGVDASQDPRTLAEWSRAVAVSSGALRNWCRTAGISARGSLLFARTLRAVIKHSSTAAAPEDLLNIVARRTLAKVLRAAGGTRSSLPGGVEEFFERQTFVKNATAIEVVSAVLHTRHPGIRPARHVADPETPPRAATVAVRRIQAGTPVTLTIAS